MHKPLTQKSTQASCSFSPLQPWHRQGRFCDLNGTPRRVRKDMFLYDLCFLLQLPFGVQFWYLAASMERRQQLALLITSFVFSVLGASVVDARICAPAVFDFAGLATVLCLALTWGVYLSFVPCPTTWPNNNRYRTTR